MSLTVSTKRLILLVGTTLLASWCLQTTDVAFAANDVETPKTIISEEKKPEVSEPSGNDTSTETDLKIPEDALPNLDPNSVGKDTEDDSTPDESASPLPDDTPIPEVMRDLSKLPEPVRRMHSLLLKAARSGKIESLRNLIGIGESATNLSIGGLEGDPIQYLKEASGDDEGYEILAILLEVLEAGFVHTDAGTDDELYVWPYFFAWPLDKLSPEQKVELYRILTAGDVQDSQDFGGYIFYRVGIAPDGSWDFFLAGD